MDRPFCKTMIENEKNPITPNTIYLTSNVFHWDTAHHWDSNRPCAAPRPTLRQQKRGCRGNKLSNPRQLFTKMGHVKDRKKNEREENIQNAITHYENALQLFMRASAEKFDIPHSTLRDRLNGAQSYQESHRYQQQLTEHEAKAIVRWCQKMNDWGFSPRLSAIEGMAAALIAKRASHLPLGKNWLTRFLNRNPELAARFSNWLERERVFADNPATLKDYFAKVIYPKS
jgi:hypothetical protein